MTARKWSLPTWVQDKTTGSSHFTMRKCFLLSFLTVSLLASLVAELKLGFRMCMSDHLVFPELTMLSNRIGDYPHISQGKTRIPGVNDAEEFDKTVVSREPTHGSCVLIQLFGPDPARSIADIHMTARSLFKLEWAHCTGFTTPETTFGPAQARPILISLRDKQLRRRHIRYMATTTR